MLTKQQEKQFREYFRARMAGTGVIDVRDLPKEDIRILENFIELLRKKEHIEYKQKRKYELKNKEIKFAKWDLGVKGKLSRDEIYDYL